MKYHQYLILINIMLTQVMSRYNHKVTGKKRTLNRKKMKISTPDEHVQVYT